MPQVTVLGGKKTAVEVKNGFVWSGRTKNIDKYLAPKFLFSILIEYALPIYKRRKGY